MRVFVTEFLCGGALAGEALPPTLAAEGRAMWASVCEDVAGLEGVTVTTTRDSRVAPLRLANVQEIVVHSASEEQRVFAERCRSADIICIIAPELEGELERRVHLAQSLSLPSACLLNASPEACALAGDKWATSRCLERHGVPTIPTRRLSEGATIDSWPLVVKPRFGAGSQNTFLVRNRPEFDVAAQVFATENPFQQGVLQPYVSGRSLSAMALFDIQGRLVEWLPVGEQILSDDGRFHYQGGRAPAEGVAQVRTHELLTAACGALQAEPNTCLRGPIGFDVIEAAETGELFIVDINPRFTTSYVGYRQLARHNLLAGMMGLPVSERSWRTAPVAFSVAEGDHGC